MKAFAVALTLIAGSALAQDQPKENWDCISMFDQKILGCDSAQSCKDNLPRIEACIVHLQSINEFCKTAEQVGVCYRGGRYRQAALTKLNDRLPKYPEYIAYYEKAEQEKAEEQARKDAVLKAEEEKREAARKVWQAQEDKRLAKEAVAQAEAARKEKQRLATCTKIDPYVGMSESTLLNLCNRARWEASSDYGTVKYTHYRTGYARVMVRNGVVAVVSY